MFCNYGCGNEANFQLKNGKWCCSNSPTKCTEVRFKISTSKLDHKDNNLLHLENKKTVHCEFCNKFLSITGIKSHKEYCYLNPINKKLCPVCEEPIKHYKTNKTCSSKCGSILSKNLDCLEHDNSCTNNYREKCFRFHGRKCLLCNEVLVLQVHHIDGNRSNNDIYNIIPLCPTHHSYCHIKELWYVIKECIEDYISKFKINH